MLTGDVITRSIWSETLLTRVKSKGRKPKTPDPDQCGLTF